MNWNDTCAAATARKVRGYPYKRSHLVALRTTKISASDDLRMCNLHLITATRPSPLALFRVAKAECP